VPLVLPEWHDSQLRMFCVPWNVPRKVREAVFVGSGIFMKDGTTPLDLANKVEREDAETRAKAIVLATTHYQDPKMLAEVSETIKTSMKGLAVAALEEKDLLQTRGW